MPGIDPASGTFVVPIWAAAAVAALFVVVCVMAFGRFGQMGTFGTIARYAAIVVGALLVLTFLDRATQHDRAAERRALEARSAALTARAIAPGSALACLDAGAGDTVENSCEKAVFANPETVAAAVSYVAARLRLLNDGLAYAKSADRVYEKSLAGLRKAIAADRFGIVAHVLFTQASCVVDRCAAFTLVSNPRRIKLNLKNNTFAALVARHSLAWSVGNDKPAPVAAAAPAAAPAAAAPTAAPTASALPNLSFPSAASIPPVSIMDAEPPADAPAEKPAASAPKAAAAPAAKPPAAPRRPPARSAKNNGNAAAKPKPAPAAPMTLTPPSTAFDTSAPNRAQ